MPSLSDTVNPAEGDQYKEQLEALHAQHERDMEMARPEPPEEKPAKKGLSDSLSVGGVLREVGKDFLKTNPVTAPNYALYHALSGGESEKPKSLVFPSVEDKKLGPDTTGPSTTGSPELLGLASPLSGASGTSGHGAYESSLISPKREGQLHEAQDEGMHLAAHQGYAEAKAEDSKAAAQEQIAAEDQNAKLQQQQLAQQRFAQAQQNLEQVQKTYDDLAKQPEINPDRWWDNQSTGAKIGYAFAAALAGFGQGWNHDNGPNPVIQHIKDAVQQDVAAQADSYHRKEKLADVKNTLYSQAYALTGDRNQALIMANQLGIEAQIRKAQAVEHSAAAPVVKAHAAQLVNDLQKEQIEEDIKRHPMVQASAGTGPTPKELAAKEEAARAKFMQISLANGVPVDPQKLEEYVRYQVYGLTPGHPLGDIAKHKAPKPTEAGGMSSAVAHDRDVIAPLTKSGERDTSDDETNANPFTGGSLRNLDRYNRTTPTAEKVRHDKRYNTDFAALYRKIAGVRAAPEVIEKALKDTYLLDPNDPPAIKAEKLKAGEDWQRANQEAIDAEPVAPGPSGADEELPEFQSDE